MYINIIIVAYRENGCMKKFCLENFVLQADMTRFIYDIFIFIMVYLFKIHYLEHIPMCASIIMPALIILSYHCQ